MAQTQINGGTQIKAGTITLDRLVSGYSIPTTNLADGANFLKKDGSVTLTGALNLGGFAPTNSGTPSNPNDLTTKSYVDAKTAGIGGVADARVVATTNQGTLSGLLTIDGVTLVAGDIVLLTAQTTGSQNGLWTASASAWTRPAWWASASVVKEGYYFFIAEGTTYKETKWWLTTTGTITVDTTSTGFVQDTSGGAYTAGTGLTLTGGAFSVNYGTTSTTAAAGNDARITGALQTSALGTGVQTALGVAVGSAGAPVVNGGALGTPSAGTLSSCSGLPAATGLTGTLAATNFPALTGDVTTTAGSLSTTVNHTSGSGFCKYTDFIANETPSGTINGSNATFTLANTPATVNSAVSSLEVVLNGVVLEGGSGNDYTLSGNTITMLLVPQTGDKLRAYYMK